MRNNKKKPEDEAEKQEQVEGSESSAEAAEAAEGAEAQAEAEKPEAAPAAETADPAAAALKEKDEQYLRLLAEYDNFRKRSTKERESAWQTAKAETAAAFLPVYDNLKRALTQECADEAYAKGVQMTMTQLTGILEKLGIAEIPALGEVFNPELHNAVMHIEDEAFGENTIAEVFETGFSANGKVLRFAMVKVAN